MHSGSETKEIKRNTEGRINQKMREAEFGACRGTYRCVPPSQREQKGEGKEEDGWCGVPLPPCSAFLHANREESSRTEERERRGEQDNNTAKIYLKKGTLKVKRARSFAVGGRYGQKKKKQDKRFALRHATSHSLKRKKKKTVQGAPSRTKWKEKNEREKERNKETSKREKSALTPVCLAIPKAQLTGG